MKIANFLYNVIIMQKYKKIKLIFGPGNVGSEYENTRHNFGRDLIKNADLRGLDADSRGQTELNFSAYRKYGGLILSWGRVFVNESGKAIGELIKKFKLKPEEILVIHDEADLPFLWLKLSFGKKAAGHKGIESIRRALKTYDFWRLRIGIQGKKRKPAMEIILKKLKGDEEKLWIQAKKKFGEILNRLKEATPDRLNIPQKFFIE